jgi:hypothetical protein
MPNYNISLNEIEQAKLVTKKFDLQKCYEKIICDNNWLGWVGEKRFKDYLGNLNVIYTWNTFVKNNYTEPDFIVEGKTVDCKCTYDNCLWLQKPEWDIYVLAIMNRENTELSICGFIDKVTLEKLCKSKKYIVERESRKDFRLPVDKLRPMTEFKDYLMDVRT